MSDPIERLRECERDGKMLWPHECGEIAAELERLSTKMCGDISACESKEAELERLQQLVYGDDKKLMAEFQELLADNRKLEAIAGAADKVDEYMAARGLISESDFISRMEGACKRLNEALAAWREK